MTPNLKRIASLIVPLLVLAGAAAWWHFGRDASPADAADATGDFALNSSRQVSISADNHPSSLDVVLHIRPGWHVNANPPSPEYLIPATVTVFEGKRQIDAVAHYPPGRDSGVVIDGKHVLVYEDATRIPVALPQNAAPTKVVVRVQACNDAGTCLPPANISTRLTSTSVS